MYLSFSPYKYNATALQPRPVFLSITDSTFSGCLAEGGSGGGVLVDAEVLVSDTAPVNRTCSGFRQWILSTVLVTMQASVLSKCAASVNGGAIGLLGAGRLELAKYVRSYGAACLSLCERAWGNGVVHCAVCDSM